MKTKKGLVVQVNADNYVVEFQQNTLKVLQGCVQGLIEPIDFGFKPSSAGGFTMWINEEGKINGSDPNFVATAFYQRNFVTDDIIFGDVVFTGLPDEDGETQGLDESLLPMLQQVVQKIIDLAPASVLETLSSIK